jgi:hypothetical protein
VTYMGSRPLTGERDLPGEPLFSNISLCLAAAVGSSDAAGESRAVMGEPSVESRAEPRKEPLGDKLSVFFNIR